MGEALDCPACGGAGGGPFGRAGSAWDVEGFVCPRCQGMGFVREGVTVARPLAKSGAQSVQGAVRGPGLADAGQPVAPTVLPANEPAIRAGGAAKEPPKRRRSSA